ncbi:MAG: hypothetical protein V3W41_16535 [Planctomycetota bacterium]
MAAFAATLVTEALVALAWARWARCPCPLIQLFTLNLITHPLAFVLSIQDINFWVIEFFVVIAEGLGYRVLAGLSWQRAFVLSGLANLVSLGLAFL